MYKKIYQCIEIVITCQFFKYIKILKNITIPKSLNWNFQFKIKQHSPFLYQIMNWIVRDTAKLLIQCYYNLFWSPVILKNMVPFSIQFIHTFVISHLAACFIRYGHYTILFGFPKRYFQASNHIHLLNRSKRYPLVHTTYRSLE